MNKDIKLSNVKGLLIFLVVFGHLIAPYQKYFNELYLFIYSFHMPLFVLVSGYFAKRATVKKALNLIMIYLIFQLLYESFLLLIKPGHVFNLELNDPYYHLWYLVGMAVWYLIAIGINRSPLKNINKAILVLLFLVISIASRYATPSIVAWMQNYDPKFHSHTFGYQRILSFMPFFFIGLYLTEENMHNLYKKLKGKKLILITVMSVIFAGIAMMDSTDLENIFKGDCGIDELKGTLIVVSCKIIISYVIALIMCYAILNIMSSKQSILTKWGDRSLPIFLFHIFITRTIKTFPLFDGLNHILLFLFIFMIALIIVSVLSSNVFMNLTYYLWNPYKSIKVFVRKFTPEF